MTSPQPPAHRPRKGGRWPLQRPTLPPGVSDGRGWVTVNKPTRPDRDPARLISRRARALCFTLTRHISSMWFRQSGFGATDHHPKDENAGMLFKAVSIGYSGLRWPPPTCTGQTGKRSVAQHSRRGKVDGSTHQ